MKWVVWAAWLVGGGLSAQACDKVAAPPDGWALIRVLDARSTAERTVYSCRVLIAEPTLPPVQAFQTPGGILISQGIPRLLVRSHLRPDGVEFGTIGLIAGECALVTYYRQPGQEPMLERRFSACLPGLEQPPRFTAEGAVELEEKLLQGFDLRTRQGAFDDVLLIDAGPQSELIMDARDADSSRSPYSRVITRLYAGERISLKAWRAARR